MSAIAPLMAVVDDDPSVRTALARLLRAEGFGVETFPSGPEFLASLRLRQPHCVLLDVRMPDMGGLEVQEALRQAGMRLPVILISSDDSPRTRARAIELGASAYLLKPFDGATVLDAIRAALEKSAG